MIFQTFGKWGDEVIEPKIYRDVDSFMQSLPSLVEIYKDRRRNYLRIGAGFDIETTNVVKSHIDEYGKTIYDKVAAFAYHFQIIVEKSVLLVRTWGDCTKALENLNEYARRHCGIMIIWVANLGFEFQFIRKRIPIQNVFARETRQPIYFKSYNLEFRDCLRLTNSNLAYLAKNYCDTPKLVGDLDYSKPRNSKTPLTQEEENYCINDVVILSEFAQYCYTNFIDKGTSIPYTSTGIVRQMIKNRVHADESKRKSIEGFISRAYIPTKQKYMIDMTYLFRGGFTHANAYNANRILHNVYGVDLRSSYPAVMLQAYYPMSPFVQCRLETDGKYITDEKLDTKCCIFIARFTNIRAKTHHTLESKTKIILPPDKEKRKMELSKMQFDNGRLYKAESVTVFLTELDYQNYLRFYEWDCIEVSYARAAARGKLPEYLLQPLRELYKHKDKLKAEGADDKHSPLNAEYKITKARINSFFGMCCTRLMFINPDYNTTKEVWENVDSHKTLVQLKRGAFLSPYWGIYITAHARNRLCKVITDIDPDKEHNSVIYYDTDSIYFLGAENMRYIDSFNESINSLNTDFDFLGCFDMIDEKPYLDFKTIGAKRYLKRKASGEISATIAGLNGDNFVKRFGEKSFEKFSISGFDVNAEYTDKNTCFYVDDETTEIIDGEEMTEKSCAVISPIGFRVKHLKDYEQIILDYVRGL